MCMLPMDPVVPPVLNNGSGNAYFAIVATPGAASTQLTIAGNIMETQKTLAKACSSWKFTFPAMLHCVHALPRVRLPGVQVGGRRRPAWARTGAGVGPAGGRFFDGNVHFHEVFKGISDSRRESLTHAFYKGFGCSVCRSASRSARSS